MLFDSITALQRRLQIVGQDAIFRRMVTNSGWILGSKGITLFLNLGQEILIARMLGVALYGVLGLVITFVVVVNRLTSFRMNEFVVKYVSDALENQQKGQAASVIKIALLAEACMSVLAFVIILLIAPLGNRIFVRVPGGEELIILYAFVVLGNSVIETTLGILHVFNQFKLQSVLGTIGRAIALGVLLGAYWMGASVNGVLIALMAGNFVTSALMLIVAWREVNKQLGKGWWYASLSNLNGQWRSISRFTFSTNASTTLSLITKDSDLLWLGFFQNATQVGYFKLTMTMATLLFLPIKSLIQTIYPEISRLASAQKWQLFRSTLRRASWLAATYVVPLSLALFVLAPWLITVFYGAEFIPASKSLRIILIGIGFSSVFFWNRSALLALNLPDYPLKINFLISVIKLLGIFILLPVLGYIGNAILLTGLYFLGVSLTVRKVARELRRHESVFA